MSANNNFQLLSGKPVAQAVLEQVRSQVAQIDGRPPCVVFIRVGNDPASVSYVKQKQEKASFVGIKSILKVFEIEAINETMLLAEIHKLNEDTSVDGILVQAPLPKTMDFVKIASAIKPEKDVDGFGIVNCGRLQQNLPCIVPCTPAGIIEILKFYNISTAGKHVVIVNRSMIVGKPLATLLLQNTPQGNATVTICHSHTKDLRTITREADILVLACGKPAFFDKTFVKEGAIVIDVGISRVPANNERGYVLQGDANSKSLEDYVAGYTPVPGGVGPMTVAMLMKNTLDCYKLCHLKS
ncbi:MAG: bifunctional 5,10-methylenetetrahydrofolate dehydrogenase/5,10-methenyltetrahydrofolate cyclohydrolase [bacterium]